MKNFANVFSHSLLFLECSLVILLTITTNPTSWGKDLTQKITLSHGDRSADIYFHYQDKDQDFASRAVAVALKDFPALHEYFNYIPRSDVHFNIDPVANSANGSAQVFPYNIVNLINFPPFGESSLMGSKDWVRVLVVHEYTHILTIEMTHGWMQTFRTIFGSTAKWAGINPRWFLEGIATWAESKITGEGRVNDPRIRKSLINYWKRKGKCTSFSCMDYPNIYPYGSLAYWFGALFLDYAEKKHPGLMSCWAKENSSSLPLFVDKRYRFCSGSEIFEDYYDFLAEIDAATDSAEFKDGISNSKRSQDLFAGSYQGKKIKVWVTDEGVKGRQAEQVDAKKVWVKDFQTKKATFHVFPYSVEQIYGDEQSVYLGTYWDGFYNGVRDFYQLDPRDNKTWISLNSDVCNLKVTAAEDKKIDLNNRQLIRFYHLNSEQVLCWYFFEGKHFLITKKKDSEVDFLQWQVIDTPNPLFGVDVNVAERKFSYFENPTNGKKEILLRSQAKDSIPLLKAAIANPAGELKTYNPYRYFLPSYLFLQYFTGGNMDSIMMSTHLQDPRQRHRLDIVGIYNTNTADRSPWSGGAVYNIANTNWANFGGLIGYNKFIARFAENSQQFNIRESVFAGPTWSKQGNEWMYLATAVVSKEDQNDILYNRQLEGYTITQRFTYKDFKIGAWWQLADWELAFSQQKEAINNETYPGYRIKQEWLWRLAEDHYINSMIHHARLVTPSGTAREGAIYGGGVPNFFVGDISFPSFVVAPSGIFGRELTAALLQHQYRFWYKNPENGISSFTVRSMEWFWGLEYLKSDWLVLTNRVARNPEIASWHAGVSFNTHVFYLLPVKFSLAYAKPFNYGALDGGLNLFLGVDVRF
jgi:hypothetical protein